MPPAVSPPSGPSARRPPPGGVVLRPTLRSPTDVVAAWIRWFGAARLAVTVVGCVVAAAGLVWALRAPAPSAAGPPEPSAAIDADGVPVVTLVGATTTVPPSVWVHVAGAVAEPGVHELASGGRVVAALAAAGGPLADAELDALNLAAPVADGQRIYVPAAGEVVPSLGTGPAGSAGPPAPIDVNSAAATELERLPGVGPAIAAEIVEERERNGPFTDVEALIRVRGIGPAKLDAVRDLVVT